MRRVAVWLFDFRLRLLFTDSEAGWWVVFVVATFAVATFTVATFAIATFATHWILPKLPNPVTDRPYYTCTGPNSHTGPPDSSKLVSSTPNKYPCPSTLHPIKSYFLTPYRLDVCNNAALTVGHSVWYCGFPPT